MTKDHRGGGRRRSATCQIQNLACVVSNWSVFSETPPEFFQRKEPVSDTESECPKPKGGKKAEDSPPKEPDERRPVLDTPVVVQNMNPVTESDLEESRTKDTPTGTTRARAMSPRSGHPAGKRRTTQTTWGCALHLSPKRVELTATTGQMDTKLPEDGPKAHWRALEPLIPLGISSPQRLGLKKADGRAAVFRAHRSPPSSRSAPAKFANR